jgi:hypothetical protein
VHVTTLPVWPRTVPQLGRCQLDGQADQTTVEGIPLKTQRCTHVLYAHTSYGRNSGYPASSTRLWAGPPWRWCSCPPLLGACWVTGCITREGRRRNKKHCLGSCVHTKAAFHISLTPLECCSPDESRTPWEPPPGFLQLKSINFSQRPEHEHFARASKNMGDNQ